MLAAQDGAARRLTVQAPAALRVLASAAVAEQFLTIQALARLTLQQDGFDGESLQEEMTRWEGLSPRKHCVTLSSQLTWGRLVVTAAGAQASLGDFEALIQEPRALQCIALAKQRCRGKRTTAESHVTLHVDITATLYSNHSVSPSVTAEKLRLLLSLPFPYQLDFGLYDLMKKILCDTAMLRENFGELPLLPHKRREAANQNRSGLFRLACSQGNVAAAVVLLFIPGPCAVDPPAYHQASMQTACWRNMPEVAELLLVQTGERAVRMQPGKRRFFWDALHSHPGRMFKDWKGGSVGEAGHWMLPGHRYATLGVLLGATGLSAVPPYMWMNGRERPFHHGGVVYCIPQGPVERLYQDVGWMGGSTRVPSAPG
jgi:hypothetical protein